MTELVFGVRLDLKENTLPAELQKSSVGMDRLKTNTESLKREMAALTPATNSATVAIDKNAAAVARGEAVARQASFNAQNSIQNILAIKRANEQSAISFKANQAATRAASAESVIAQGRVAGLRGALVEGAQSMGLFGQFGGEATAVLGGLGTGAVVALGGVALLTGGLIAGVAVANDYVSEVKAISQQLALAGNVTGQTAEQFRASVAQIAADTGSAYDEVEAAQLKLISSGRLTGDQIDQLTRLGAGYANTFGVDMSDATNIVATAFQGLGNGDLRALQEGFGFLDASTRDAIIRLSSLGQSAEAQKRFIEGLTASVAGSKGSASGGLGTLKDATIDYVGALLNSFGPIRAAQGLLKGLAQDAIEAAAKIRGAIAASDGARLNDLGNDLADAKARRATFARISPNAPNPFDAAVADFELRRRAEAQRRAPQLRGVRGGSNSGLQADREVRKQEARTIEEVEQFQRDRQRLSSSGGAGRKAGKSEAERAAEKAAREAKSAREKDAREAAAATRELEQSLQGLRRAYDPVATAQAEYKAQLAEITALESERAGKLKISADEANRFREAAKAELTNALSADLDKLADQYDLLGGNARKYREVLAEIAVLERRDVGQGGITKARAEALRAAASREKIDADLGRIFKDRVKDAGAAGAKEFKDRGIEGAQAIAQAFGGRLGGEVSKVLGVFEGLQSGNFNSVGGKAGGLLTLFAGKGQDGEDSAFTREFKSVFGDVKDDLKKLFGDTFGVKGIFGEGFKEFLGRASGGAAVGGIAGTLGTKILGVRGSKTGSALGGAAGSFLPIPGGAIIGGLFGGVIGGAFKKTKTGSASVGFDGSVQNVGGTSGNSASRRSGASALLKGGIGDLSSIAEQLGGILTGAGTGSLGVRKDNFVFDPTGKGRTKGAGVQNFGKDEAAARSAFVLDQLKDGAVAGFSDKVRAALTGSADLERGLREALKVDELEGILGGFGAGAAKEFRAFEQQAKERLRIATQYGFDVVKLEAENAKQRKALFESQLAEATGGLRELLDDFRFGDRATGSLLDRRTALIGERTKLEADAGTDPAAAAKLRSIIEQIDAIGLEAFGTAGTQFASDRASNIAVAQRIIDQVTQTVTSAQGAAGGAASTDALIGKSNQELVGIKGLIDELTAMTSVGNVTNQALLAQVRLLVAQGGSSDPFAAARNIGASVLV